MRTGATQENNIYPSPSFNVSLHMSCPSISKFCDFLDRIITIELERIDTTDTARSASYLDLHIEIDSKG